MNPVKILNKYADHYCKTRRKLRKSGFSDDLIDRLIARANKLNPLMKRDFGEVVHFETAQK